MNTIKIIREIYMKHGFKLNETEITELRNLLEYLVVTSVNNIKKHRNAKSDFIYESFDR